MDTTSDAMRVNKSAKQDESLGTAREYPETVPP